MRFIIVDTQPTEIACGQCDGSGSEGDLYCGECRGDGNEWIDLSRWQTFAHNVSIAGAILVALRDERDTAVQCATCALAEVA